MRKGLSDKGDTLGIAKQTAVKAQGVVCRHSPFLLRVVAIM